MAFIEEINKNSELISQVEALSETIRSVAEAKGIEVAIGVDTPKTVLEKLNSQPKISVDMVQKPNGAYTLTITKG